MNPRSGSTQRARYSHTSDSALVPRRATASRNRGDRIARRHAPTGRLELAPNDGGPRTGVVRRARTDAERGDRLQDEGKEAGFVTDVAHGVPDVAGATDALR